jgi:hypothetical protein
MSGRESELARRAAALAPTLVGDDEHDPRSQEAARVALRALAAPTLGPREAHTLITMALERGGGSATLALGARLALDRVRRPPWLRALVLGLGGRPRPELWASLSLAADGGVTGAARALTVAGSEAAARFLAGCGDGRARLLGIACACAGRVDGGAGAVIEAIDGGRGAYLAPLERMALEDLERGLVALAAQVLGR